MIFKNVFAVALVGLMSSCVYAMQDKPKNDFKAVTLQGLNNFAFAENVGQLTPRSYKSLLDRYKELGVKDDSNNVIAVALAIHQKKCGSYNPETLFKYLYVKQARGQMDYTISLGFADIAK